MSQFDNLLDFEPSSPHTNENGTSQKMEAVDPFDPFGPSPTIEIKGGADPFEQKSASENNGADPFGSDPFGGDDPFSPSNPVHVEGGTGDGVLLDFSYDAEVNNSSQNGKADENHYEVDFVMTSPTDQSESAIYEEMEPQNPLYENAEPSNLLYEYKKNSEDSDLQISPEESSNPLYEYIDHSDQGVELLVTPSDDSGIKSAEIAATNDDGSDMVTNESESPSYHDDSDDDRRAVDEDDRHDDRRVVDQYDEDDDQRVVDQYDEEEEEEMVIITEDCIIGTDGEVTIMKSETETLRNARSSRSKSMSGSSSEEDNEQEEEVIRDGQIVSRTSEQSHFTEERDDPNRDNVKLTDGELTFDNPSDGREHPIQQNGYDAGGQQTDETYRSVGVSSYKTQFENIQQEPASPVDKKPVRQFTPPREGDKIVYSNEDSGFQPNPDVIRSVDVVQDESLLPKTGQSREIWAKFEKGVPDEKPSYRKSVTEELTGVEGGEYESKPIVNPDVVKESDERNYGAELPGVGTAKGLVSKFKQFESTGGPVPQPRKREITPPDRGTGKVEYVSEPTTKTDHYEGRSEAGIFENQPQHIPNVIRSGERTSEDAVPQQGYTRNVTAQFKEIEYQNSIIKTSAGKRELTPDRDGRVEYVSEPREVQVAYEGRAESGVFENEPMRNPDVVRSDTFVNEEDLPQQGYAKNLAAKFRQFEDESGKRAAPAPGRREITPDRSGRVEYVSQPTVHIEKYEGRSEAGVFENKPQHNPDVVRSDEYAEEQVELPQRGYAKNVAARFQQMESENKSPSSTPRYARDITPPAEGGIFESTPVRLPDVIRSEDQSQEDVVPQHGSAKSMAARFRQIEEDNSRVSSVPRQKKEVTPMRDEPCAPRSSAGDPDAGTYENQPTKFVGYKNKREGGVYENKPKPREDVCREDSVSEEPLPESGTTRNMVSKFKQIESNSSSLSPRSRKEFTPPRAEPRVVQSRSPISPHPSNPQTFQPADLPEQYQEMGEPGVFESNPAARQDVSSEANTDWTSGLPAKNTTSHLLQRFKSISDEQNQPPPTLTNTRKEAFSKAPTVEKSVKPQPSVQGKVGKFVPVQLEKCASCQKTVYAMEKLEVNKAVYHKMCFKCSHCSTRLNPGNYSVNQGIVYCTNHYKQMFARKGNYDEGFGREQYKKKWQSEPNLHAALEQEDDDS